MCFYLRFYYHLDKPRRAQHRTIKYVEPPLNGSHREFAERAEELRAYYEEGEGATTISNKKSVMSSSVTLNTQISSVNSYDKYFGTSVCMSSSFVLIGDPATCKSGFLVLLLMFISLSFAAYQKTSGYGSVFVYKVTSTGGWSYSQTLRAVSSGQSLFGSSVAIYTTTAMVGAPGYSKHSFHL